MCPLACKEVYYAEFESRLLKPGEDPSIYKWELKQILSKAEPDLETGAKDMLLTRQFMKGLPKSIWIKLLKSNPDLNKMVSFVQKYRAIQEYAGEESGTHVAEVASETNGESMASLVALGRA